VADTTTAARLLPAHLCRMSDETVPAQGMGAVVVGLGRAGLGLHIPVLEKIRRDEAAASPFGAVVGLVDTAGAGIKRALHRLEYDYGYDPRPIRCATSLADLPGVDPDHTIVHICTPDAARCDRRRISAYHRRETLRRQHR
jgi:hypothetical protein